MTRTTFTQDQLDAIEYKHLDVCVVAGPGAGKTTVLVERYKRLVVHFGFRPREILAITFTEKAAANMKSKLAQEFSHDPHLRRELEIGWVSTIHGFCMRLLRENAIAAGLDPRFSVLSPRESDTLQWECLQFALDEMTANHRAATLDFIEALHAPILTGYLKDVYDGIRSAGLTIDEVRNMPNPAGDVTPVRITAELRELLKDWPFGATANQKAERARLLDWCLEFEAAGDPDFPTFLELKSRLKITLPKVPPRFKDAFKDLRERIEKFERSAVDRHAAPFRSMIFDVLTRFDIEYRTRKNTRGRVDFNDLERHAIALLKDNADVLRRVRIQFRQIMLNEFQDINGQQAELISLLRAEHVFFGVGDVNQSIYGFRHARPEIFREYRDDVALRAGQSVELLHNFRSRQAILHCVREVLADADGIEDRPLVSGASFAGKAEPAIEVMELRDQGDDKDSACEREAKWIAHRILELRGTVQLGEPGETSPAEFRDFAVLCRNGDSMPPILAAFDRAGIPYVCGRRQSFLLSRIGFDITALLSVIANPRDQISLATLLRSPLVGVGDEALLHLSHTPFTLSPNDRATLTEFYSNLDRWRQDQPIVPLDMLLARALSDCGVNWTPSSPQGADIECFLQLARTTGAEMDLPAFLHELEGLAEAADTESELSDEDQGNAVRVMTVHAAKGLEFPITIVAAMDKGARTESNPVTFTPEHGLGVKWRNPASKDNKKGLKDSWAEANSEVSGTREDHEENRLLYVAMTRAAEHLILSWSRGKDRVSNWAKRVDGYFQVSQSQLSLEPRREHQGGFEVSILVTDADPPPFHTDRTDPRDRDIQIVPRPSVADQHETTATVTSLAVFGSCPRKYYIQRSLGWNTGRFRSFEPDDIAVTEETDDEDEDLSASRVGTAVHSILAGLTPVDESPEARQLADVFRKSSLGLRAAASSRKAHEWSFIADIDGTILRGSIDLWFEDKGNIHLVDYKTDAVSAADAPARALDYAPQLALYAIALERALGSRPATAWLHFLRPDTIVEIPLDDAAIAAARSVITRLRKAQDDLRFDLNEGDHCRTCQFYRSLCPAGQSARTDVILELGDFHQLGELHQ